MAARQNRRMVGHAAPATGSVAAPLSGIARDAGVRRGARNARLRGGNTAALTTSPGNASKLFDTLSTMGYLNPGVDRGQVEHVIGLAIGE